MNHPTLKATLASIAAQRAALAKVRAEAEDLDDYLAAIDVLNRDTGERIPMATVHRKTTTRRKATAR